MTAFRERWFPGGLIWLAAVMVAVALASFADYKITEASLPDLDPSTTILTDDPAFAERTDIEESYADRAWLYPVALLALVVGLLVARLRATQPEQRRELFTDLGVLGVLTGGLALWIGSAEPTLFADGNAQSVLPLFPVTCLVLAAGGSVATSVGKRAPAPTPMPSTAKAGLVCAALTILFVLVASSPRECGETAPGWSDSLLWLSLLAGVAAGVLGLISLFQRRWVVSIVTIPMPLVALIGILVAACLE